jgi:DNA-directed RNA polymerase specialized sigma subunit
MIEATKPEAIYRAATDAVTRRHLAKAVVEAYRARLADAVRKSVPAQHVKDATQAGLIGVLRALEAYEPATAGEFWPFALRYVRDELQGWADHAVEIQRKLVVQPVEE